MTAVSFWRQLFFFDVSCRALNVSCVFWCLLLSTFVCWYLLISAAAVLMSAAFFCVIYCPLSSADVCCCYLPLAVVFWRQLLCTDVSFVFSVICCPLLLAVVLWRQLSCWCQLRLLRSSIVHFRQLTLAIVTWRQLVSSGVSCRALMSAAYLALSVVLFC
jgi:hypothetical protein